MTVVERNGIDFLDLEKCQRPELLTVTSTITVTRYAVVDSRALSFGIFVLLSHCFILGLRIILKENIIKNISDYICYRISVRASLPVTGAILFASFFICLPFFFFFKPISDGNVIKIEYFSNQSQLSRRNWIVSHLLSLLGAAHHL